MRMKVACTVWSKGKSGDDIKGLPIAIDVRIRFVDGTVIRIGYPKENAAIWWIEVEKRGTAVQGLTICNNEDAKIYSDIFKIDAEIKSHSVIKQKYPQE